MHELSVTEAILDIAVRHAHQAGAGRITDIYLALGQLSTFLDDSVQFYWDFISPGTIAEGAQLHFRRIPAEVACLACDARFSLDERDPVCPECGANQVKILRGDEFYVEAIDVVEGSLVGPASQKGN